MLLLPLVCVVVRSAKQFRLQCTQFRNNNSSISSSSIYISITRHGRNFKCGVSTGQTMSAFVSVDVSVNSRFV